MMDKVDNSEEIVVNNCVFAQNESQEVGGTIQKIVGDETKKDQSYERNFWMMMRACAQRSLVPKAIQSEKGLYIALGENAVLAKSLTNLKIPWKNKLVYCSARSVVFFCQLISRTTYKVYEQRVAKKKAVIQIRKDIARKIMPFLCGKTDELPDDIDQSAPNPELIPLSVVEPKLLSGDSSIAAVNSTTDRKTLGETCDNESFYLFFHEWLFKTGLECKQCDKVVKLSESQRLELDLDTEEVTQTNITVKSLPSAHIYGLGFGSDAEKSSYGAARDIIRRLYYIGLITPFLYQNIGNNSSFGRKKRIQRSREWKTIIGNLSCFIQNMTQELPDWFLNKDYDGTESGGNQSLLNGIIERSRQEITGRESRMNAQIRRKRRFKDGLELAFYVKKQCLYGQNGAGFATKNIAFRYYQAPSTSGMNNGIIRKRKRDVSPNDLTSAGAESRTVAVENDQSLVVKKKVVEKEASYMLGGYMTNIDPLAFCSDLESAQLTCIDEGDEVQIISDTVRNTNSSSHMDAPQPKRNSKLKEDERLHCNAYSVHFVEEALSIYRPIKTILEKYCDGFKKFNEHIWRHYKMNLQDDKTFSWKMRVRKHILEIVQKIFPCSNLFAVGSTVNGCGSYNSDMDLCLCVADQYCGIHTNRDYAVYVLKKVWKKLLRSESNLVNHCQYIPAKVPILKLQMATPFDELEIDMNCNNVAGIYNSHLLHYYARLDERFPALCLIVKHWAINAGINDAMSGTLNSYSLILMVLHYLQCAVMPPVLPNLQALYPEMFAGTREVTDLVLFKDLPHPLPAVQKKDEQNITVGELLIGFFSYFAEFNFKDFAISVSRACIFSRDELADSERRYKIFIEEPFDYQNTARCVTKLENFQLITRAIVCARDAFLRTDGPPLLAYINVE